MANVVTFQPGGYRFIEHAFQYSGGVAAEPGFAIERARKLGVEQAWEPESVVACSFGDASVNHATAQAALNSAAALA